MGLQHPKCGIYQRCFDKIILYKFFYQFFSPNFVNYLWRLQAAMKNDITIIKPTSDFKINSSELKSGLCA